MEPKYTRVLLKLSGESLSGDLPYGLEHKTLSSLANQIKELTDCGIQVGVVVGGGNIWRGVTGSKNNSMDRAQADSMGMLATTINALALQGALEAIDVETRVMTAIDMPKVAEPYIRRRAIRHLEKGRVCIFACGTGSPFFSTDSGAALRAAEIGAQVILAAKKVDGVYTADPKIDATATRYDELTFNEALAKELKVMDSTAFSLCMDNNIDIIVFSILEEGNIFKAVCGEKIGTLVRR